jgi:pimeloyl-ACP methyl ester carboxylesterase
LARDVNQSRGLDLLMRILYLLCLSSLFACAPSLQAPVAAPIPNPSALEAVKVEKNLIAGSLEPHTPAEYNKAIYLRYFASSQKPRAVLVLMPGFLGGAQNFDRLARTLVSSDPSLEVWAVDRRSNALEDHSRLLEAYQKRDPMVSWRYMIRDAGEPNGFQARTPKELAFMGYWGLKVHLEDLRAVVLKAREAAPKVFLGGHSLGASLVGLYAGWDFAGTPGYKDLAGVVMIDGVPGGAGIGNTISEQQYLEGSNGFFGIRTAGIKELEAGTATPYFEALTFSPSSLAKLGAASLLASFDPNDDSPGGIVPYPASNLAAAMITGDDNYALVNIFSITAGKAVNAKLAINGLAVILSGFAGFQTPEIIGALEPAKRVDWQIPNQDDPLEHTDPLDFAGRFWTPNADFQEWYFPTRLTLEVGVVGLEAPSWAKASLPLTHLSEVKLPILAIRAGRGIVTAPNAFEALEQKLGRKIEIKDLPGYTHLDILAARANALGGWLINFMK